MNVQEYIERLEDKGFVFGEDIKGFIFFGKEYTGASDVLVNAAIEITLKVQKTFDGSFYIALLETLKEKDITTRKKALQFAEESQLLVWFKHMKKGASKKSLDDFLEAPSVFT